jgi:hypothetical protein
MVVQTSRLVVWPVRKDRWIGCAEVCSWMNADIADMYGEARARRLSVESDDYPYR